MRYKFESPISNLWRIVIIRSMTDYWIQLETTIEDLNIKVNLSLTYKLQRFALNLSLKCTKSQQIDFLQSTKNDVTLNTITWKESNKNERTKRGIHNCIQKGGFPLSVLTNMFHLNFFIHSLWDACERSHFMTLLNITNVLNIFWSFLAHIANNF